MRADYHIHSEFSDDSREPMEEQIKRAIELGLDEICFTDHVDYGIKKDWSEGNIVWQKGDGLSYDGLDPLANVDYPVYLEKIAEFRKKYGRQITIRTGLEFGIQTITLSRYEQLWNQYGRQLDFVLLSIHQINNLQLWNQDYQNGKNRRDYYRGYYEELLNVIRHYKNYSVLAHLDLISRYDRDGSLPFEEVSDLVTEILKTVIADGKGIEINTSSWHYGLEDTQPSKDILKLYRQLGGKIITIGSDAHTTKYLADHLDDAIAILKDLGFSETCTFEAMKPVFHKL